MEMVIGIILATVITAAFLLRVKKQKLPPGPIPVPIFGNLLQLGTALNHRNLAEYSKKFGEIFHLRLGQKNVVVISSPKLAKESLYKKGAEFGSRYRSVVHDIFTGKGQVSFRHSLLIAK
ncbi:cinnamic acid 4-hydroxylase [Genlisea aurea]|uniref:Cinnamic acid 4-hydroxylase n=1 Tax=Genlisea aurea TaxID=192259 RepID=S8CLR6_9LAMI|nr:cinnamic acid 4-hydroxylase [Genlisea aurea]